MLSPIPLAPGLSKRFTRVAVSVHTMMPRNIGATLLLAALAALGYSTLLTGQPPEHTFVAVVRADGSMVPVAAFDGREWWNRWPEASGQEDKVPPVPSSLASIPSDWLPPGIRLPADWRVYAGGGRLVPVRALRPIRTSMSYGEYVIGLETSYKRRGVRDESAGAVAVSGVATVGGFVRASGREADAIAKQLAARLDTIEQTEIAQWIKETERPTETVDKLRRVFRDGRQSDPVTLSLMRAERPSNGRTYYHLTGEKLYAGADPTDDSCKMNMSFDGVVATDPAGRVVFENVSAFAWAEYCGDRALSNELIATIQVRDQWIWVGVEHLEDGFSYFLIDPHLKQPMRLRVHPFVRVRLAFYDDACSIAELCQTLDDIRSAVASRSFADLAPYISGRATDQIDNSRNLVTELKDPRSVAWPALERVLTLGGRVQRAWRGDPRNSVLLELTLRGLRETTRRRSVRERKSVTGDGGQRGYVDGSPLPDGTHHRRRNA